MISKLAKDKPEEYQAFWSEFGPVLKEGAAQDFTNKEILQKLLRFKSTDQEQLSLDEYVANMKEGQEKIIT